MGRTVGAVGGAGKHGHASVDSEQSSCIVTAVYCKELVKNKIGNKSYDLNVSVFILDLFEIIL